MKKLLAPIAVAILLITAASCKKDSNSNSNTKATFTIDGTTYNQTTGVYSLTNAGNNISYATLGAGGTSGSKKYVVVLVFGSTTKPTAGSYKIVPGENAIATNEIAMLVSDSVSVAKEGIYTAQSGSATVSVSSSGKLSVKIPSCVLTGSNYDHTDPNNTNITDATVDASGSVIEN